MEKTRIALAALAVAAASALAGTSAAPVGAAGVCADPGTQVFLPWGDSLFYALATGGSMESPAGWTLSGYSQFAQGNEPFFVNSASDNYSLHIPAGSSATSPWTCLGDMSPVARVFALARGPNAATLQLEVLYKDKNGAVRSLKPETISAGGHVSWAPTTQISVLQALKRSGLNGSAFDETAEIAFRFTASDGPGIAARWWIDDLYVDPWAELLGL